MNGAVGRCNIIELYWMKRFLTWAQEGEDGRRQEHSGQPLNLGTYLKWSGTVTVQYKGEV